MGGASGGGAVRADMRQLRQVVAVAVAEPEDLAIAAVVVVGRAVVVLIPPPYY